MPWQEGQALPYDGWYGGRVDMMIKNGTFADFRPKILSRVEKGFYSLSGTIPDRIDDSRAQLAKWDAQWETIPIEERIRARNRVADDVEIKEKIVYTARGPVRVFRSKPSNNNNLARQKGDGAKKKNRRLPTGSITRESSPLSMPTRIAIGGGEGEATPEGTSGDQSSPATPSQKAKSASLIPKVV